ncbi:MAG: hypothetical protein AAGB15_02135 [Pseudomonadota bacterium]
MRGLIAMCIVAALAACEPMARKQTADTGPNLADRLSPGCYTVDLFDPYRINYPEGGVSPDQAAFLGRWTDAAWNGDWCHELYITDIASDGTVSLLDAYGPYPKLGIEAQVFRRTARIENGELSFTSVAKAGVTYKMQDGYLVGRRVDLWGEYDVTMAKRQGVALVPIPPKNPRRG